MVSRAESSTVEVPSQPPSAADMRAALGDAYPKFQELVAQTGAAGAEWRRYSKNSPWVLKVSDGKRSLFYARPEADHLRVTVLLGARAVEAALAGRVSKDLHESIRTARSYPEGRPVTVLVKRRSDLAKVEQLIAVKRETTARPGGPKALARGGRTRGRG